MEEEGDGGDGERMKNTDPFSCILKDESIYHGNGTMNMVF